MLDKQAENISGVSDLSQGLNKDAISKQNSQALIEQVTSMAQQRQKIMARHFANQFLKPLYQEVYQLCIENEDQEKIIEIGGEYVPINPAQWADKRDVTIALTLGYGENKKESEKYMAMHQVISQDPNLSKMYQQENQYAVIKKVMELSGIKDTASYITPPDRLPEEQPDPAQQMQMQMAAKQIEIQERQTKIAELKLQLQAENDKLKHQLDVTKAEHQFSIQSDSLDIKEDALTHKKIIDSAELALATTADEITAIASPNG